MSAKDGLGAPITLKFLPMGELAPCTPSETILDCARRHRIRLASSCGGQGSCMSCAVQVADGAIPAAGKADEDAFSKRRLAEGWRRACLTKPTGDCTVFIPARSTAAPLRTHVDGTSYAVPFDPEIVIKSFDVTAPILGEARSDDHRLLGALKPEYGGIPLHFDAALLRELAEQIRAWGWRGKAVLRGNEIIAVGPQDGRFFGLAVDLGTTNISGMLVDMETGITLATDGVENPQTAHGADLITYASLIRRHPEMADTLQRLAADALNRLAHSLTSRCGGSPANIVEMTIAGNVMMHHLFLHLPVKQLAMSPYVPTLSSAFDVKAREVGIHGSSGAYIHMLPNIAGFIGGDHVAALLAATADTDKPFIVMDIGTNTEISLVSGSCIASVSCPSGPALEGGHISAGMRAAMGAIEIVHMKGNQVQLEIIGDGTPVGICGSGVLDTVAQLLLSGACDRYGRLNKDHPRVRTENGMLAFILADENETGDGAVLFTQEDLRAVQLAKAAIRAATDLLLEKTGHMESDLGRIVIAGAFGNYLDIGSALAIGMLPDLPFNRFVQIGNAAADGARMVLVNRERRRDAQNLGQRAEYIELAGAKSFMRVFGHRINFPERAVKSANKQERG